MLVGETMKISDRALAYVKVGRKRNPNVRRDSKGKSRGEPEVVHPETLAIRKRHLRLDGITLTEYNTVKDGLAGTSLGRLLLRHRQDESNPGSISQAQYDAGARWAEIVTRHQIVMGYGKPLKSPSVLMVGGGQSCSAEPSEETIKYVRDKFKDCYDALQAVSKDHGWRLSEVCYGVAVENWPLQRLSKTDYGRLRIGLNALARVLSCR